MMLGIGWVGSGSALMCSLAAVWRNSWGLRWVRSVLVLEYHSRPCIVSASIFFLYCPYRVVHPGFWFCILPVGGWSAYSKSTNSCSCSSPCRLFRTPPFVQKKFVAGCKFFLSVVSPWYFLFTSCHTWSRSGVRQIADHQYEEHVLFVSNQIYYWIYKCTTSHYYTNIIKTI